MEKKKKEKNNCNVHLSLKTVENLVGWPEEGNVNCLIKSEIGDMSNAIKKMYKTVV